MRNVSSKEYNKMQRVLEAKSNKELEKLVWPKTIDWALMDKDEVITIIIEETEIEVK
jgi:hypothetical protein